MPNVIGFIPARGGSKSVPRKNMKLLGGRPLIDWTIDVAKSSGAFAEIIVSSDDREILDFARLRSVKAILRPEPLASDTALTVDVVLDYLNARPDLAESILVLLQPTSPFRSISIIQEAVSILKTKPDVTSVVSVVDVGGYHPFRMKRIVEGRLVDYIDQGFEDMRPRQVLPKTYIRSGTIYASRVFDILKTKSLLSGIVAPLVEEGDHCINIDSLVDFYVAERFFDGKPAD